MSALVDDIERVARLGADAHGGVSRLAWSEEQMAAQRWLVDSLTALGLAARLDAAGNVVGTWRAGRGRAVAIGSHLDTVPCGGRFDGALGVLAGLDALRALRAAGARPRRPLRLLSFMDEEGARFGSALFGSNAYAGTDLSALADRRDADGITLRDAMARAGFDVERLAEARAVDELDAYVELHIEQGRVLEDAGADIGIVTALAGILVQRATFEGVADHAGTTPMGERRDALAGGARAVLTLRDLAAGAPRLLRITVGSIEAQPGGFNVVPGGCELSIDLRAEDATDFVRAEADIAARLEEIAREEGLRLRLQTLHRQAPTIFDARVRAAIADAAAAEGARTLELASGAGHDAMVLAPHVPAGMLFVPSRDGVSHNPAEYTDPAHCELGARVLARAALALAGGDDHEM